MCSMCLCGFYYSSLMQSPYVSYVPMWFLYLCGQNLGQRMLFILLPWLLVKAR
jgi:hypothetical protein